MINKAEVEVCGCPGLALLQLVLTRSSLMSKLCLQASQPEPSDKTQLKYFSFSNHLFFGHHSTLQVHSAYRWLTMKTVASGCTYLECNKCRATERPSNPHRLSLAPNNAVARTGKPYHFTMSHTIKRLPLCRLSWVESSPSFGTKNRWVAHTAYSLAALSKKVAAVRLHFGSS